MGVLRSMFPNVKVPDPEAFYFPRWFTDPLYRGSYSNWPASFFSDHHKNLRATVDQRLWFAGEATSMKWFGDCLVATLFMKSANNGQFFEQVFCMELITKA
jgi:polyamine oxidase